MLKVTVCVCVCVCMGVCLKTVVHHYHYSPPYAYRISPIGLDYLCLLPNEKHFPADGNHLFSNDGGTNERYESHR